MVDVKDHMARCALFVRVMVMTLSECLQNDTLLKFLPLQVIAFLRFVGGGKSYATNARPLQPLNGRQVEFNL